MSQKAVDISAQLAQLDPDTRARIQQAVLEIFSQREFHRVSLIEIARGANVSLQTIYKYYGSKEALLFSTLDHWMDILAERMLDHLQGIEDYKERLRKVFWVGLDFFEKNPKVAQLEMSSVYVNTWRKQGNFENPVLFGTFIKVLAEGREWTRKRLQQRLQQEADRQGGVFPPEPKRDGASAQSSDAAAD